MTDRTVPPPGLGTLTREALRAVHEALDIPYPATYADSKVYDPIMNSRVLHAIVFLRRVIEETSPEAMAWAIDYLRARLAEHPPVGYRAFGSPDGGGESL